MIRRFLNWQGVTGIAVALTLLAMLTIEKLQGARWKSRSERFEQLYKQDQAAFATTVADARAAALSALEADRANAARVAAEQRSITERTNNDFEARLATARADAQRLRLHAKPAPDPRVGRSASMPGFPSTAGGAAQTAREDGFSQAERLTATEQAIQLDELIKWIRAQAKVDNNPSTGASRRVDRVPLGGLPE